MCVWRVFLNYLYHIKSEYLSVLVFLGQIFIFDFSENVEVFILCVQWLEEAGTAQHQDSSTI